MRVVPFLYRKQNYQRLLYLCQTDVRPTRTGQRYGKEIKYKSNNNYIKSKHITSMHLGGTGSNCFKSTGYSSEVMTKF